MRKANILLGCLAATANKLDRLIKGMSVTELRRRPALKGWSVNEIVAHLADGEIVIGFRIRFILGALGSAIIGYDQDQWVISGQYDKHDPHKSAELFSTLRAANLALLELLEAGQWKHFGVHSERGQESIEQIVRMIAGHDINHLQQIERILTP
jgi:DinB superfamily